METIQITDALAKEVASVRFGPPVAHVYNPLAYAREPYVRYLERFGTRPKEVVLLGMNPGPWGMAQTGVPFGEVSLVRDWLGITAPVGAPPRTHPKKPVQGFACHRSEVSGKRLWGWAREAFGDPDLFFSRFFVLNYCPLMFLDEHGANRTPDKLPAAERRALFGVCDRALRSMIECLAPDYVVGIGRFAEQRAREALAGLDLVVGGILHPSPANPRANREWKNLAEQGLSALGIRLPGH